MAFVLTKHMTPINLAIGLVGGFSAITAQITIGAAAEPGGKQVEYGKLKAFV
jgi:hypothetical protein